MIMAHTDHVKQQPGTAPLHVRRPVPRRQATRKSAVRAELRAAQQEARR